MDQIEQVLGAILQTVPPDLLIAFLQIISQMNPQEIQQLMQMISQAAQQQGAQQQQQMPNPEQQGNANLYG